MYDIIIIGAGVAGCSIARELSKYKINGCVVEKCEDVCCGTSKANSAIIHAGFDAAEGSLMAKLNVRGSQLMPQLAADLDFPYKRNGSLVVCLDENELAGLEVLYQRGLKNGVKDLQILNRQKALAIEPNLSDKVCGALYAPTGAIVCPFNMTIALAENAAANGFEFKFNCEVFNIEKINGYFKLSTSKGDIYSKYVVNAAGVYADTIHNMVSANKMHITPRRGDYCLLDKNVGNYVSHTIFQLPSKMGKGVLVTPTVHGNLLVGPTAIDVEDKEGNNTTASAIEELINKANNTVKQLPIRQVITSFAGLRAHEDHHEFIIEEVSDVKGFVDCAGIESPGLSSAPAIGEMVAQIFEKIAGYPKKENFISKRKGIIRATELSFEERNALIKRNPAYGNIICRCEQISEGEIIAAINSILPATSLDGIKRRVRAGMGRCQGGFCSPKVMQIICHNTGKSMEQITKSGGNSFIVKEKIKAGEQDD